VGEGVGLGSLFEAVLMLHYEPSQFEWWVFNNIFLSFILIKILV